MPKGSGTWIQDCTLLLLCFVTWPSKLLLVFFPIKSTFGKPVPPELGW